MTRQGDDAVETPKRRRPQRHKDQPEFTGIPDTRRTRKPKGVDAQVKAKVDESDRR